jgi:hypothetical protein
MFEHDTKTARSNGPDADVAPAGSHIGAVNAALTSRGGTAHAGAQLHDDATSHAAADALGAQAFTAGTSVFFGAGQHAPGTPQGDALLRHELTHVDQARGVAAPQPGNFRVSDPADGEEHAARSGQAGAAAQPHTIYRSTHGGHAPAAHGAGPAAHGAAPVAYANGDPYPGWKAAIDQGDRAQATALWAKLSSDTRARVAHEPAAFLTKVVHVMQKDAPQVLKAAHADLDHVAPAILSSPEFAQFLPTMRAAGLVMPFIHAAPHRGEVTDARAKVLQQWVDQTDHIQEARALFHKVYPALHDHASPALPFDAVPLAWTVANVRRLYGVLAHFLPVGHVQTISGGFVIQKTVDFGWYEGGIYRVTLPGHVGSRSAAADLKQFGNHDMTGGGRSGSRKGYTKDGKPGTQAHEGHFTITALHEVGHGVGDRMGGNAYATNKASYPGWTPLSADEWAHGLWAKPDGHGDGHVSAAAKLTEVQARAMFLHEIENGAGTYQQAGVSHADMVKWVTSRYANVPLFKWWRHLVVDGFSKDDAYRFSDLSARIRGDWTYAYLTRADSPYLKLKTPAFNQRVSWYSVSSPLEWFAEQYAHYYRTEKTGGGLIDPATKHLLHELDHKSFKAGKGSGHAGHGADAGDGEGEGDGDSGGGVAHAPQLGAGGDPQAGATPHVEPLFFPW